MDFSVRGIRYSIQTAEDSSRIRLWVNYGHGWMFGHGKQVPPGMSPRVAEMIMYDFVRGVIGQELYDVLLPGK